MKKILLTIALLTMLLTLRVHAQGDKNIERAYAVTALSKGYEEQGILCFYKFNKAPGAKELATFFRLTGAGPAQSYSWSFADYNAPIPGLTLEQQDKDSFQHILDKVGLVGYTNLKQFQPISNKVATDYYIKWTNIFTPVMHNATTGNAGATGGGANSNPVTKGGEPVKN
jgi:hypothetical protein